MDTINGLALSLSVWQIAGYIMLGYIAVTFLRLIWKVFSGNLYQ